MIALAIWVRYRKPTVKFGPELDAREVDVGWESGGATDLKDDRLGSRQHPGAGDQWRQPRCSAPKILDGH